LSQRAEPWKTFSEERWPEMVSGKCMLNQRKCTGQRPRCKSCQTHNRECHYAREPGERAVTALKREFEALQSNNADEHETTALLCSLPVRQALEVLMLLRTTKDVSTTLRMARSLSAAVSTPAEVVKSKQQITEANTVREKITHQLDVHTTRTSFNPFDAKQGCDGELLIDPYVSVHTPYFILLAMRYT
jgi:tRNA/tmRNA/rRNA uracil-C5-methylase (TrmA/RlmC/RlmD family)